MTGVTMQESFLIPEAQSADVEKTSHREINAYQLHTGPYFVCFCGRKMAVLLHDFNRLRHLRFKIIIPHRLPHPRQAVAQGLIVVAIALEYFTHLDATFKNHTGAWLTECVVNGQYILYIELYEYLSLGICRRK